MDAVPPLVDAVTTLRASVEERRAQVRPGQDTPRDLALLNHALDMASRAHYTLTSEFAPKKVQQ